MGAFAREQAELAAGGLPAGVAEAGTVLPDVALLDVYAAPVRRSHSPARDLYWQEAKQDSLPQDAEPQGEDEHYPAVHPTAGNG